MSIVGKILGGAAILGSVALAGQAHAIPVGVNYVSNWQGASNNQTGSIALSSTSANLLNTTSVDISGAFATINTAGFFVSSGASPLSFAAGSNPILLNGAGGVTSPFSASWQVTSGFGGQTFTTPDTFTFTSSISNYGTALVTNSPFMNIGFFGSVSDSQGVFATQAADLSITLNQATISAPVSAAFSFQTPYSVPEPISMSILGLGLAGLAAVRRRTV